MAYNPTLDFHIIGRTDECFDFFPVVTMDTYGTQKDVVIYGLFIKQGLATIFWTGGPMGEYFLNLMDSRRVDTVCDAHRVLEVSQIMMFPKHGGAEGRYGLGAYKMDCKKSGWTGKIYDCTGVRYGDWNHTRMMKLDKFG